MRNHPLQMLRAKKLIGDEVKDLNNEVIGKIEELVIASNSNDVRYAIMSLQGNPGDNAKFFPIPWSALRVDTASKSIVLTIESEKLEYAPGFHKDNWPDMSDDIWNKAIHCYYDQPQPYLSNSLSW